MSDAITKILREFSVQTLVASENGPTSAEIAMAKEIERLRARVAQLEKLAGDSLHVLSCVEESDGYDPGHRCSHCDEYVDRNGPHRAALRAALKEAAP